MPKPAQACAGSAVGAVATRTLARNDNLMRRRPAPDRRVGRSAEGTEDATERPPVRLADRAEKCLRCPSASGRRRSGALFGARAGALDRRLGCGRRHPQHRLPRAVLYALLSCRAASVLAPVAAPV